MKHFLYSVVLLLVIVTSTSFRNGVDKLDRAKYSLEYPAGWSIDSSDEDFDFDSYFTFDSKSGNGFITFLVFDTEINPDEFVDEQIKAHKSQTVKNGVVTGFNKWGAYNGRGALIQGKVMGIFKGQLKVFAHSCSKCSFMTVSQLLDSDKEEDVPGLDMIERTFKMKE